MISVSLRSLFVCPCRVWCLSVLGACKLHWFLLDGTLFVLDVLKDCVRLHMGCSVCWIRQDGSVTRLALVFL